MRTLKKKFVLMSTEKSIYFQISLLGFGLVELITGEEEHPLNKPILRNNFLRYSRITLYLFQIV